MRGCRVPRDRGRRRRRGRSRAARRPRAEGARGRVTRESAQNARDAGRARRFVPTREGGGRLTTRPSRRSGCWPPSRWDQPDAVTF
ncbi:MAG: hypothetical protein DI573_05805 [Microbacterium sp.]|nr:MAG: hypothetical protein DI573_05805 [Microbacterium sp.]